MIEVSNSLYFTLLCFDHTSEYELLYRCGFLCREVQLLMQLLEEADIPDPLAGTEYLLLTLIM